MAKTMTVEQLATELEQKRTEMKTFMDDHILKADDGRPVLDSEGRKQYDFRPEQLDELNRRNDELTALGKQYDEKRQVARIADANERVLADLARPANPLPYAAGHQQGAAKSVGEMFVEHKAFDDAPARNRAVFSLPDVDLKALFTSAAGWAPFVPRRDGVLLSPQQPPRVIDLLPKTTTSTNAVKYMEETTFTNAATEVAEGATYPEATLVVTEQTSPVQKIAVYIPVTDEELEDVERLRDYINNRLSLMIAQRLDQQILAGNGTAPNLRGVLNVSGINTQAVGADPAPTALYKASTLVRTQGFADPGAYILNPNNWQAIRTLQDANGQYIWGHPAEAGPERIWGQPVVQTTFMAAGTAVVGDWNMYAEAVMRRGIDIQISNSHDDYFIKGKQAIRADVRVALLFRRAKAFTKVTGLPS